MARRLGSGGTLWRAALAGAAAASLLFAQDTVPKDKAVFEGSVVDSVTGQAVSKAAIHLSALKPEQPGYSGRADANGRFRFAAIAPGDYHLAVSARGYIDATAAVLQPGRANSILHFSAGQSITGASVLLDAEAIITGRVTDAQGEALPSASITALRTAWQNGSRAFTTAGYAPADDRGEYRLKLPAGRYSITAGTGGIFSEGPGKPEMRLGPAYYPGGTTIETAAPIELRAGQQMGGVDFKLPAMVAYHVRGALVPYVNSPGLKVLYLRSRNGLRAAVAGAAAIEKDGSFDLAGVPPGSYMLDVPPIRGMPTAAQIPIDVTDRDVNGVKVPAMAPFELRGHARFEENEVTPPAVPIKLVLQNLDVFLFDFTRHFSVEHDGSFTQINMQCAEYVLRNGADGDVYVKSATIGGRPVVGGRVDLRNGPPGEIEIVLGTGTGEVTGAVRWPDANAGAPPVLVSAGHAILVSPDGPTGNTGARSVEIDSNGQFRFPFVPPGRWLVFVSPSFEEGLWQNAEFVKQLATRGMPVDLPSKGAEHVDAPPLTAEDLDRAVDKVRP